jgi:hypothetical protein
VSFTGFGKRAARPTFSGAAGLDAWLVSDAGPSTVASSDARPATWDGARLTADLVYDTATTGLPTGVRALVQQGTRRLLYSVGEYEILLRIAEDNGGIGFQIVGQVLHEGLPMSRTPVRLGEQLDGMSPTMTDHTGGFRVPSLVEGAHHLEIATQDGVIDVSSISIGTVL